METNTSLQRLDALHQQISAIDEEIMHLFQQRKLLVDESEHDRKAFHHHVAQPDSANGSVLAMDCYLTATGELPAEATVACQGVEGAFSHQAADCLFQTPHVMFYSQFEEVFLAVAEGRVDYCVFTIENYTPGSVGAVYDLMGKYDFYIVKEAKIPVRHALLAKRGVKYEEITQVYSHPQALSQCEEYFAHHKQLAANHYSNTAAAAKFVAQSDKRFVAAIASYKCANMYDLDILAEDIQDIRHNTTRFICISRQPIFSAAANKISMCLTLPHKPGALYHLLNKFAINQLNLTKLESRPWPERRFEFMFYLDIEGSFKDLKTRLLLEELNNQLGYFKILGGYNEA